MIESSYSFTSVEHYNYCAIGVSKQLYHFDNSIKGRYPCFQRLRIFIPIFVDLFNENLILYSFFYLYSNIFDILEL